MKESLCQLGNNRLTNKKRAFVNSNATKDKAGSMLILVALSFYNFLLKITSYITNWKNCLMRPKSLLFLMAGI